MRSTNQRRLSPTTRRTQTRRTPSSERPRPGSATRQLSRGLSPKRQQKTSPLFGVLSLIGFALFWVFLVLAFNSMMVGAQNADGARMVASGLLGVLSFMLPILGLIFGLIGVMKQNSQKVVAGIGLSLNVLLLGWIVLSMMKH